MPADCTFKCLVCGADFQRNRVDRKWCPPCKPEGLRRYKAEKRRAAGDGELGATYNCAHCGASYKRVHRRQKYCSPCSALSRSDSFPAYRDRRVRYQSARNKERRKRIPSVAINERMSAGIKNSLKNGKSGRSWELLVGYSIDDLMRHLERQFLPGMTWENRGKWHIDHILPVSSFQIDSANSDEFRRCWCLTNLRPVWASANIKKSNKRTHLI